MDHIHNQISDGPIISSTYDGNINPSFSSTPFLEISTTSCIINSFHKAISIIKEINSSICNFLINSKCFIKVLSTNSINFSLSSANNLVLSSKVIPVDNILHHKLHGKMFGLISKSICILFSTAYSSKSTILP